MRYILWLLSLLATDNLLAQKHDYNWILPNPASASGTGMLIPPYPATHFNFESIDFPSVTNIGSSNKLPAFADLVYMSDSAGIPVLYSNGLNIYHPDGAIMENGAQLTTLDPYSSSIFGYASGYRFLCVPHDTSGFFLFHVLHDPNTGFWDPKFYYHQVKNNKVVVKRKKLYEPKFNYCDGVAATKHANGRDWWIVFTEVDTLNKNRHFHEILLTNDTMMLQEDVFVEQYSPYPPEYHDTFSGQLLFSPNGKVLVRDEVFFGALMLDFDRCDGSITWNQFISVPIIFSQPIQKSNDVAFSKDSRYLYLSCNIIMLQFDLWADDIFASRDTVGVYAGELHNNFAPIFYGILSLAPDGRIYQMNGVPVMGIIHHPERKGASCNFKPASLPIFSLGITPFIHPNYRLGPIDGSPCDTLGIDNHPLANFRYELEDSTQYRRVTFTDLSDYEPDTWHWDLGDGTTSQDTSPVHLYAQDGIYNVCLRVSNAFSADTLCRVVNVGVLANNEPANKVSWTVSPNPAATHFTLTLPEGIHDSRLSILDLQGRVLREENITSSHQQVHTEGLNNGTYFLQLSGDVTGVQKLVVLR